MKEPFTSISGGVVAPKGFKVAAVHCGLKSTKADDLALIVSDVPAVAAGVFTTNVVKANCVLINQDHIKQDAAQAIVANAGNANACNGEQGRRDALSMVQLTGRAVGVAAEQVFVASTGVIGHALPMDKISSGIAQASQKLHGGTADDAAHAIMTTDTFPKQIAVRFELGGVPVSLGAMAKGAGMIEPNMATMLAFITTDVAIEKTLLQSMLCRAVEDTFNSITVDGDTSTNDMCLVLANGLAKNKPLTDENGADSRLFESALAHVCAFLAKAIARDGEGATKRVELTVRNIATPKKMAKTIANSPLVKTALFGNDPNWGRILAAAGRSGVAFDPAKVEVSLAGTLVYKDGAPVAFDRQALCEQMKAKEVQIFVDFHQKEGESATVWTCDLGYDYIKINADYHT